MSPPATPPVRVVLVDDSVVIRRVLTDLLAADPTVEVVGTAANGKLGLDKIRAVKPDIVILDIEMPVMDGLATLPLLRAEFPQLPVIMFSTLTTRGGTATLDALSLGATDYLTKPETLGGREHAIESIRAELLPKVKTLGRVRRVVRPQPRPGTEATLRAPLRRKPAAATVRADVVAVAVSTGGPKALQELIPRLPGNLPIPIVLVQHMPPVFTGLLAERLDRDAALHVVEAEHGTPLRAGTVYIAPGGRHMVVAKGREGVVANLNDAAPENSCRPAADPLFRSVVAAYGAHAFGVVLTGMGSDGCKGAQAIVEAGGSVVAQDEATSVVWGMPGAVVRAGIAAAEVPLDRMADEIVTRVAHGRVMPAPVGGKR
jgi:two-component system, chemotaxis family, protein-glutamate methylesterase/glutaminase